MGPAEEQEGSRPKKARATAKQDGADGSTAKERSPDPALADSLDQCEWKEVKLANIAIEDKTFQCRFQSVGREIEKSLAALGQQEPVDLLDGNPYRIVDGFRRCEAARSLGWETIKAIVRKGVSDREALRIAFLKNVVRKNLTPLERANAMRMACDRGMNAAELALAFGISERQVARYLKLIEFPEPLQAILDGKIVTMAHLEVLYAFHVKNVEQWSRRIEAESLTAGGLRALLRKEIKPTGRRKTFLHRDKDTIRLSAITLRPNMGQEEKSRLIAGFEKAIEFLRTDVPDVSEESARRAAGKVGGQRRKENRGKTGADKENRGSEKESAEGGQ